MITGWESGRVSLRKGFVLTRSGRLKPAVCCIVPVSCTHFIAAISTRSLAIIIIQIQSRPTAGVCNAVIMSREAETSWRTFVPPRGRPPSGKRRRADDDVGTQKYRRVQGCNNRQRVAVSAADDSTQRVSWIHHYESTTNRTNGVGLYDTRTYVGSETAVRAVPL